MELFPYTFESEKPHHIKNIFVMGLDKRSLHNRLIRVNTKLVTFFHEWNPEVHRKYCERGKPLFNCRANLLTFIDAAAFWIFIIAESMVL